MSSPAQIPTPPLTPPLHLPHSQGDGKYREMNAFIHHVKSNMTGTLSLSSLKDSSRQLRRELQNALQQADACSMLPSFYSLLPSGKERGQFMAIDVGGSRLRTALILLQGRDAGQGALRVLSRRDSVIDQRVRGLQGRDFFAWMADRIKEIIPPRQSRPEGKNPTPMGISWSFPLNQISVRDGLLLPMGKHFKTTQGLVGHSLAGLLEDACIAKKCYIRVDSIVNDSTACILPPAYTSSACQISLILGTGLNATAYLPVPALAPGKFGDRSPGWFSEARHVLVNTELSVFGRDVFAATPWDALLRRAHPDPDFQPLEHLTSGRYLGELVRLIVVDAIGKCNLFGGNVPANFEPYELSTHTLASIEADETPHLSEATKVLKSRHALPHGASYSCSDVNFVRHVTSLVTDRAAAYVAASLVALCTLQQSLQATHGQPRPMTQSSQSGTSVGCNGSVIERYPRFRERTQGWIDVLGGDGNGRVRLQMTGESALVGAAVAVACRDV